jgi:hypothetical protein
LGTPIGVISTVSPANSASVKFSFTVTAFNRTGTYVVQAKIADVTVSQYYIEVYSERYITLMPYDNNMRKWWDVTLPPRFANGGFIMFWFRSFETEESNSCSSDYLSVYNAVSTSVTKLTPEV